MNVATQTVAPVWPTEDQAGLPDFELPFGSLFIQGRVLIFPCDALGRWRNPGSASAPC